MATAIDLVRHFRQLRALVIGDVMLDTYLEGTASRLCSEGPVPVVRKTAEHRIPGGAANTAANLRALDADVVLLGVTGHDIAGTLLRAALRERGVNDQWLVEDESMSTLHKLRILADGQYVVRFDEGGVDGRKSLGDSSREDGRRQVDGRSCHYSEQCQQRLLANLEETYPLCDLVIVSDYRYGVASDVLIERLRTLQAAHPKVLLIDSKALHRFHTVEATVVTPNYLEARLLVEHTQTSHPSSPDIDLVEVKRIAQQLLAMLNTRHVAITLAEHGVFLLDRQGNASHLPAHPVAHANDVGAGDSFAAAMALALGGGVDGRKSLGDSPREDGRGKSTIEEAAQIGIDAASIAITRRWTAVVHHQELLQRVSVREYAAHTRSLAGLHEGDATKGMQGAFSGLMAQLDAERLVNRTIVFTNGVFDILHAGHVQFLREAKALGDVLVVGINSDTSTQRLKGKGRPINSERDRMALVAALDAVDHVVLFDEDTPTELIRVLRPDIHVKGGDYADEALPEAEAVREVGGQVVILPLAGSVSTTSMIDRIVALASDSGSEELVEGR